MHGVTLLDRAHYCGHVSAGLAKGWNPVILLHSPRSRIICGQRQFPFAEPIELHTEIARTARKVLLQIPRIDNAQIVGRARHQLRQSHRSGMASRIRTVAAFLGHQGIEQSDGNAGGTSC